MATPVFVGAGTGVTTTGTTSTVSKTSCTEGNIIVLYNFTASMAEFMNTSNHTNIEGIDGTPNAIDPPADGGFYQVGPAGGVGRIAVLWGRCMADGTCSVDVDITAADMVSRLYEFSGASTSTDIADVVVNEDGGPMNQAVSTSQFPFPQDPSVTTLTDGCLAMAFVAANANTTVTAITGETGGDWVEPVAEYADTPGMISLQTADLDTAGTIGGGSCTLGVSASWCCDTLALAGAAAADTGLAWIRA